MPIPRLALQVRIEILGCTSVLTLPGGREGDRWHERICDRPAEHTCINCGEGVCIRCTLPCYECGENLHEMCREDHGEETGHAVDVPPRPALIAILEREVNRVCAVVDGQS
jgi:hypothetical protein